LLWPRVSQFSLPALCLLPHRTTHRRHLPPQMLRQEQPREQASLTVCTPSRAISWTSSPGPGPLQGAGMLKNAFRRSVPLEDLHETGRLWDLRNFRTPLPVPHGTASKDCGDSLKAILALAERHPAQSLPQYILRAFAQFLPALLMPCSRRGKPRHITTNARRFQRGEWEACWTLAMRHNNREFAHRAKKRPAACARFLSISSALDMRNIARAKVHCQRQTRR